MSDENIKPPSRPDNSLALKLRWTHDSKTALKFKGTCLKQSKATFTHKNKLNSFIIYELDTWSRDLSTNFTLCSYLFEALKLTKNVDSNKYGYSGCDIGLDER